MLFGANGPHGAVNYHAHSLNRTPSVRSTTRPFRLYKHSVAAEHTVYSVKEPHRYVQKVNENAVCSSVVHME